MYDLVICNGVVVDGTGADAFRADVAVAGGRIVEIGRVEESAARVIDASDLVVAPGFVDPHTHYDAQLCWDPLVTPSSWHGVTTVVTGNCGVGVAPCRPEPHAREVATWDLVTVEQIPFEALREGLTWDWTSFPDYMAANDRRGLALNVGHIAPLTPFRHFVMGEAALERAASPEETAAIKDLLKTAVAAGALGFSLTTLPNHVGYKGMPLASRLASREELTAYCNALGELGRGSVELAVSSTGDLSEEGYALIDLALRESGRPVTWIALLDRDDMPEACARTLAMTDPLSARGAKPQVSCRPLTLEIDLAKPLLLAMAMPCMQGFMAKGTDELARAYADPDFRARFREELRTPRLFNGRWDWTTVHEVTDPSLEPLVHRQVADIAAERGRDPLDTFFDLAIEDGLRLIYNLEALNTADDRVTKLITDPRTLIGISDGGAHVDMLCDASYSTYLLGHWVRERGALSLEHAVKRLTSEPADLFGLRDRGRLKVGAAADIVVFDPATVGSARRPTEVRYDLPAGGRRMITPAEGVLYTIVNGQPVFESGRHTGALPGRAIH